MKAMKPFAAWAAAALLSFGLSAAEMPKLPARDAADPFFDPKTVQTIHIEIKPEDLERMRAALPSRIAVPGIFRALGQTIEPVSIRYKGNSSSHPEARHKRSFLIDFTELAKGQRFLGLRHVALDNGVQFGSLYSEPLITAALRDLGVIASRCNHARLYLNGEPLGVYVNVERIDRSFLERHFGNDNGLLFKVDEGGPGADLRFVGDDPALYRTAFELKRGSQGPAFAQLLGFIRALNDPKLSEEELRQRFELDSFITASAVFLFSGAFDQYTGWNPHNYYLHQDRASQRWTYLPWDLDVGFADQAFGKVPVLQGWDAAWAVPLPGRPLMEQIVNHPGLLRQYRQQASAILESHFRPEILIPKLRAMHERIRPGLEEDPFPPRRATVPSDASYADILTSIEKFIRERYTLARAQLDQPGSRPRPQPMEPGRNQEPRPGPASPDAPENLHATEVTRSSVQLRWTDRAQGEIAFIVQKSSGGDQAEFANAIGQPGSDLTTAVDRDVQPGQTYRYRVYAVHPTPQGPRGTGPSNIITVRVPEE